MKRIIFYLFITLATNYYLLPTVVSAQPITSTELINNAKAYDGKVTAYEGEVVGEVMSRGDYAWLNIHDGKNAIGVWVSRAMAGEISYTGTYKSRGDGVEVMGIFHRACPEHGGDLDIHAQVLRKIAVGRLTKERYNQDKVNLMITLGVICAILSLLWIVMQLKRK